MICDGGSRRPRVALATSVDWPELAPDDRLIAPALARVGVDVDIALWTDARVGWEGYDLIVVRSCWDYHQDLPRWSDWIETIAARGCGPRLCNPGPVLRWNARKTYLSELGARGVPVVPTRWLDASDLASWTTFRRALESVPWTDLVCKPAVAAGALGTFHIQRSTLGSYELVVTEALPDLARRGPVLVQPFLAEIADEGEWSLIFFAGRPSHAVRKRPAAGDFRVQERHGGSTVATPPPPALVGVARLALTAANEILSRGADETLLYARIDLVVSGGTPLLIELEITEPALFLGWAPSAEPGGSAADRLARAIADRIAALRS